MVGGGVIWARWLVGWVRRRGCNEGGILVCCVVGSGLLGEVGIEGGRCVGVGGWVKLVVIGGGGRGNLICCHVLVVLVVCWGKCIVCEGGCADVGIGEVRGILVSVWIVCHGGGSVSERVVGGLVVLIGYMWCDGLCRVGCSGGKRVARCGLVWVGRGYGVGSCRDGCSGGIRVACRVLELVGCI